MKLSKILSRVFIYILLFASSISSVYYRIKKTELRAQAYIRKINLLAVNDHKKDVINLLGQPYKIEEFQVKNLEHNYTRVSYNILWFKNFSLDSKEKLIPFFFINDNLIGWGQNFYDVFNDVFFDQYCIKTTQAQQHQI